METISLNIPEAYLYIIDDLVREGFFPNRSEAIRAAIRDLLHEYDKFAKWLVQKSKDDEYLKEVMEGATQNRAKRVG